MKSRLPKFLYIAGARPNFMKVFPLLVEGHRRRSAHQVLVHTGQHYDREMSAIFFKQFGLRPPDYSLSVGSGLHGQQTGRILERAEKVLIEERPDLVLVVGDVNSTLAGALAAAKLGIPVAHVEAGLRSFDWSMPEEINRVLTDRIADFLLIPSLDARKNLRREGIFPKKIHFVGNIMIDTLRLTRPRWKPLQHWKKLQLPRSGYFLLTLHRPNNVDQKETLEYFLGTLEKLQRIAPVVFPAHPRTRRAIRRFSLGSKLEKMPHLHFSKPIGYWENLSLMEGAAGVLTDSGGMQEESTFLGVPCLTLRPCTERPVTVAEGTNLVVNLDRTKILTAAELILASSWKKSRIPARWDGQTAQRIWSLLEKHFCRS